MNFTAKQKKEYLKALGIKQEDVVRVFQLTLTTLVVEFVGGFSEEFKITQNVSKH